jgi:hypothetical protein
MHAGESRHETLSMLRHLPHEIRRHADMQRPVPPDPLFSHYDRSHQTQAAQR